MRVVLQRVSRASVAVAGETLGAIGVGFVVLAGFTHTDGVAAVEWMAEKIAGLRVFDDEAGKMNRALGEVGGGVLVVSQFTLYADATRGRRPSFVAAAAPEVAEPLYESFLTALRGRGVPVAAGRFGAPMQVELVNDGPVTIVLER